MNEPDLIAALIALSNDLGGDPEGTIMQGVAELTRLAAENRTYAEAHAFNSARFAEMLSERDEAKAEIARLTAERDEWQRQHDLKDHRCFALAQRAENAEAEIARLHQAYRDEAQLRVALKPDTGE